jgi:hypothetical protein
MGLVALIIFLSSLALGFISLTVLIWAALQIYRTIRYARKDSQVWLARFGEFNSELQETLKSMEVCAQNIAGTGQDLRERVEDIQDTWEELRSHPLLRTARFIGKFRHKSGSS